MTMREHVLPRGPYLPSPPPQPTNDKQTERHKLDICFDNGIRTISQEPG